ncbi:MAG: phosphatidylserine decarboxylase [Treponema sp.]|nr:phosphatidylserine decarboxylase [Candidatus Treponema equi]
MKKEANDKSVLFLYGTKPGRVLLEIILALRTPALLGLFLRSPLSIPAIKPFIKKNGINMDEWNGRKFRSFNDFFTRRKEKVSFDGEPSHFISPCDSLLTAYDIKEDSTFHIKGADYSLEDFFQDKEICKKFTGGKCLVFRLCATDYHRYIYSDNATVESNHYIEGKLYCVQPIALEKYKVFTLNRRSWNILHTENFGDVASVEIGAFSVGGIINHHENCAVKKGDEKGYFDLHGSTIAMLFEKDRISLLPEIEEGLKQGEYRVKIGQWIAESLASR